MFDEFVKEIDDELVINVFGTTFNFDSSGYKGKKKSISFGVNELRCDM